MDSKRLLVLGCVMTCVAWSPLQVQAGLPAASGEAAAEPASDYYQRVAGSLADSPLLRDRVLAAQLHGWSAQAARRIGEGAVTSPAVANPQTRSVPQVPDLLRHLAISRDPLALALAVQHGQSIGNQVQVQVAARRWHTLEPDNLAPLLWLAGPVDQTLASARQMGRYDSHAYAQIRFLIQAFERVPMRPDEFAAAGADDRYGGDARPAVMAFALWAAYGIPAFQDFSRACRDAALDSTATRLGDCRHLGRVLATGSDVDIARSIGIGMLARMASSPAEVAEAGALRRSYDWQLRQGHGQQVDEQSVREDTATMLRLLRDPDIRSEAQMREAMLREKGIALVPPVDWQPQQ